MIRLVLRIGYKQETHGIQRPLKSYSWLDVVSSKDPLTFL